MKSNVKVAVESIESEIKELQEKRGKAKSQMEGELSKHPSSGDEGKESGVARAWHFEL